MYRVVTARVGTTESGRHVSLTPLFEIQLNHFLGGFKKIFGYGHVKLIQGAHGSHGQDETAAAASHPGRGEIQMTTRGTQTVGEFWILEIEGRNVQERQVRVEINDVGLNVSLKVESSW